MSSLKTKDQINKELICKSQNGCKESRNKVIELNMGLVQQIANRYLGKTDEYEDLLQIGYIALMKSIDKFDLSKDNNFSTFAYTCVNGEILNHFRNYSLVRKKRTSNFLYKKIQDYQYNFYSFNGRYPNTKEIAEYLETDVKEIEETINENQAVTYLSEQPFDGNEGDKELTLEDVLSNNIDDFEDVILKESIKSILTEKEYEIFKYNWQDVCKKDIAKLVGISNGKLRKDIKKIANKLSKNLLLTV